MEKIYIYKTTNKINGKIYIGQHEYVSLSKDDGYLGSGKKIKPAWNRGIKHTPEDLAKMRGRKRSAEARKRMADSHKGKPSKCKGKTWKLIDGKRVWLDK